MNQMDNSSLNISKDYFNTLVRRANLHRGDTEYVTLPRSEYDDLLRISDKYRALQAALIAGGLSQDNLDILINAAASSVSSSQQGENLSPKAVQYSADAPIFVPRAYDFHTASQDKRGANFSKAGLNCNGVPPTPPSLSSELQEDEAEQEREEAYCKEQEYYGNNYEDRSVTLRGLSSHTTLVDIAKVLRGGLILNMFIRLRERTAHVAFVDPIAAEKFLVHSKRSDIYIKGKRIEVFWDERQHYLQGHIARRIQNGATRNLVVRFVKADMTAKSMRDDLEHIHRLEVVEIKMEGCHAFISLSGINWAVTAKTCMTSQLKYKGTKIEFFPDECNQPLPPVVRKQPKHASPNKFATISNMNRFAVLLEDSDDELEGAHIGAKRSVSAGDAGF